MVLLFRTSTALAMICLFGLGSCQKQINEESSNAQTSIASFEGQQTSGAANHTKTVSEIPFGPVTINFSNPCFENIRFSGMIENLVHVTHNGNGGNHYSRHFIAKGMTGVGLRTGDTYEVIGGAEMFSIKDAVFNPNGTLNMTASLQQSDLFIHQGTLIFQSKTQRIVARHIIRKVPGRDEVVNQWICH